MDSFNPVEWFSWIYGKWFQAHPIIGFAAISSIPLCVLAILWIRGIDKYKEQHPLPLPTTQARPSPETPSQAATDTITTQKTSTVIDLIVDGSTKFVLMADRIGKEDYSDPQGGQYSLCEVKVVIKRGELVSVGSIAKLILPSAPHGTMTLTGNYVRLFLNSKSRTQDGTFGMNGAMYDVDQITAKVIGVTPVFHDQNWGWYPWFDGDDVVHFSFNGYHEVRNAMPGNPILQTTAIARHQNWLAKHSNGLLPTSNPAALLSMFQTKS